MLIVESSSLGALTALSWKSHSCFKTERGRLIACSQLHCKHEHLKQRDMMQNKEAPDLGICQRTQQQISSRSWLVASLKSGRIVTNCMTLLIGMVCRGITSVLLQLCVLQLCVLQLCAKASSCISSCHIVLQCLSFQYASHLPSTLMSCSQTYYRFNRILAHVDFVHSRLMHNIPAKNAAPACKSGSGCSCLMLAAFGGRACRQLPFAGVNCCAAFAVCECSTALLAWT